MCRSGCYSKEDQIDKAKFRISLFITDRGGDLPGAAERGEGVVWPNPHSDPFELEPAKMPAHAE